MLRGSWYEQGYELHRRSGILPLAKRKRFVLVLAMLVVVL
jgi:hypothetical protein